MQELNFPHYPFKIKTRENKTVIFDIVRKKYVVLTPEEWVRQHVIHFLAEEKKYPLSLMAVEKQVMVNSLTRRTDIVVYNTQGEPSIIVECKAPSVTITQETFDQIARYNLSLDADYLFVTNGLNHFYAIMDHQNQSYIFLPELPKA